MREPIRSSVLVFLLVAGAAGEIDCSGNIGNTGGALCTAAAGDNGCGGTSTATRGTTDSNAAGAGDLCRAASFGNITAVGTSVESWRSSGDPGILEAAVEREIELKTAVGHAYLVLDPISGARTDSDASAEARTLIVTDLNGGELEAGDWVGLRSRDHAWLKAENAGGSGVSTTPLHSTWNFPHEWELFRIQRVTGTSSIASGQQVAFETWDLHHYLRALNGGDAGVDAPSTSVSGWEAFEISRLGQPQSSWLEQQPNLGFAAGQDPATAVTVDDCSRGQTIRGFGATFTESAAWLLNSQLNDTVRRATVSDLFDCSTGACLKVMRLPMGPSDMMHDPALADMTYANTPPNSLDGSLSFSVEQDTKDVIPVIQDASNVAGQLTIVAAPWSLPAWMKTSSSLEGGTLSVDRQQQAAEYFVRFLQEYQKQGIAISAVTPQNEPLLDIDRAGDPAPYPWGYFRPATEAAFIHDFLAPTLNAAGVVPSILAFDHNWVHDSYENGRPAAYPLEVFQALSSLGSLDSAMGVAFHCYSGSADAQTAFHQAYPQAEIWMTECAAGDWESSNPLSPFASKIKLIIDATRNWATSVTLWTLASEFTGGPAVPGGCSSCRGIVSVHEGAVVRGTQYFALAHFSRFVKPGAVRIDSRGGPTGLGHVAFRNPDGTVILVLQNQTQDLARFDVRYHDGALAYTLRAGDVVTLRWPG